MLIVPIRHIVQIVIIRQLHPIVQAVNFVFGFPVAKTVSFVLIVMTAKIVLAASGSEKRNIIFSIDLFLKTYIGRWLIK